MQLTKKIEYLFSKINWSDSSLDAQAIEIMNSLKQDVSNLEDDYKDYRERVYECRNYLMGVESGEISPNVALESLGFSRTGSAL